MQRIEKIKKMLETKKNGLIAGAFPCPCGECSSFSAVVAEVRDGEIMEGAVASHGFKSEEDALAAAQKHMVAILAPHVESGAISINEEEIIHNNTIH